MSGALRHRGLDGHSQHILGTIGFAHQHTWVTPEEVGEIQPLASGSGLMVAFDGRIDNRDELLPALGLPPDVSDARCVLSAYEAWQEGFVARVNGDFAIALYDASNQRLLIARDPIGVRPLYFFRGGRHFAFASEIKALLAHPEIPCVPDEEGLADRLLVSSRLLDRADVTCFSGISALLPAHLAIITPQGFATHRYWDFDPGKSIRLRSTGEYAEALRERFAIAVRRRLRTAYPVAVSVSGGLDSSSVFCQAEALSRGGQARCQLVGLSYAGSDGSEADERQYVRDIERTCGVEVESFEAEPLTGLLNGAAQQIAAAEAPFIDYMWGITRELNRRASARGARVMLSGDWGDQIFFSSAYLVDLIHRFRWRALRRHLQEYVRWLGAEETRVQRRRLIVDTGRRYLPRPVVPLLKWIRRRLLGVERPRPWFSDGFLRRGLRFANRPASLGSGFHSEHARSLYFEARSKYHVHCIEWHNKVDALHGLDAALPILDRDLLEFMMAIPGDAQNPDGVPRGLLREAMRGVLPESIRRRASKADFSDLVNRGVASDLSAIRQIVTPDSLAVRCGYLDASRLGRALVRLGEGSQTRRDCTDSWDLADLVGLEMWLLVFLPELDRRAT